jgi:CheY-like chemotaxis protein
MKPGTAVRPGQYVVLAVSDTGHGMDKETLNHIFEPFFTTKGVGKGTGLGLSTVYGIVKQSDGYVWVYSEPGQGTTFKLYLPQSTEAAVPASKTVAVGRSKAGETILIVEDEPQVRQMMKRALADAGYGVLEVGSGAEALDLVIRRDKTVDLLLTDVAMPDMNGRELADQVSRLAPGTPVLFTSGYTDGEIERRGLLGPGAAFIQKPLTPTTLVRAVQERLDLASPARGRGAASGPRS